MRRQQQEETDEVYNLTDLFDNQTRYADEYFTNVVNDIRSLLNQNLVVEINGRIVKPDGSVIEEYKTTFYTRDQFESYLSKLQETSDTDEWKFTGTVKIVETNIRFNKNRSRAGMGTNYLYQIKEYEGTNCYIPSDGRCFIKCFKKLYPLITDADQMFDNFLFNDNRKDRKGIMTNARFGQFSKKLESHYKMPFNLTYYNENDRHEYPKQLLQNLTNTWCYYNYFKTKSNVGHYCLIRSSNKQEGIQEIKDNLKKTWNTCNDEKVKQVQQYSKKIQKPDDSRTYIFDLETYRDDNNFAIPYSVGLARLDKFKTYLDKLVDKEENIPEDKYDRLVLSNDFIKVFTGEDCIHQMIRYIAEHNNIREITIIAHNSSGFDSFLVAQQFKLEKAPLTSASKILSLTVSNPYTPAASMRKWKQELKMKGTKDIHQQLIFRCSFQHVKDSLLKWGKGFKIPSNLRKTELEHSGGVGIVLKEKLTENVLEVKRVTDRLMGLKVEVEDVILNVVCAYAP